MITRYFSQNPWISGPLEFLAGFGQQRQRVKEVEAGLQAQQDRDFAQSLGAGIQTAGNAIGGGLQRRGAAQQENAAQSARLKSLFDIENLRADHEMRKAAEEALFKARMGGGGGGGGDVPGGGYSGEGGYGPSGFGGAESIGPPSQFESPEFAGPPAPEFAGPPAPEFAGPPGPGMGAPPQANAVPLPSIDPANTRDRQAAAREYAESEDKLDKIRKSGAPMEDINSAIFALAPTMAEQKRRMMRHERPPLPTTDDQVFASGAAMRIKGYNNLFLRDPKTGGLQVSSGLHPTAPNEPRFATTYDGRKIEIIPRNPVQLDESTWYVEDEDGTPHSWKTGNDNSSKEFKALFKEADANVSKRMQGERGSKEDITKEMKDIVEARQYANTALYHPELLPPEPPPEPGFFERMGITAKSVGAGLGGGYGAARILDGVRVGAPSETREQALQKLDAIGAKYHGDVRAMPPEVIAEAKRLRELTK